MTLFFPRDITTEMFIDSAYTIYNETLIVEYLVLLVSLHLHGSLLS